MYTELLWIVLIFGVGVLFSYFHMTQAISTKSLLDPIPLLVFFTSMFVTTLSFIYMSIQWIWYQDPDATVLGMYALFFSGAILWAPMAIDSIHRQTKSISVLIVLWLAASGSIGLFAKACGTENILLIVASAYFLLHHVLLDGIVWFARWKVIEDQPAFVWPPDHSKKVPGADRYQHPTGRYNVDGGYVVSQKKYENLDHV